MSCRAGCKDKKQAGSPGLPARFHGAQEKRAAGDGQARRAACSMAASAAWKEAKNSGAEPGRCCCPGKPGAGLQAGVPKPGGEIGAHAHGGGVGQHLIVELAVVPQLQAQLMGADVPEVPLEAQGLDQHIPAARAAPPAPQGLRLTQTPAAPRPAVPSAGRPRSGPLPAGTAARAGPIRPGGTAAGRRPGIPFWIQIPQMTPTTRESASHTPRRMPTGRPAEAEPSAAAPGSQGCRQTEQGGRAAGPGKEPAVPPGLHDLSIPHRKAAEPGAFPVAQGALVKQFGKDGPFRGTPLGPPFPWFSAAPRARGH